MTPHISKGILDPLGFKFPRVGISLLLKWRSNAKVDIVGLLSRLCKENSALQDASGE